MGQNGAGNGRKTPEKRAVELVPQAHGGALQRGNPGNKGGGRHKAYAIDRAELLGADPVAWDVQQARARSGDLNALRFATELAGWMPKGHGLAAGRIALPDGVVITMVLGDSDRGPDV